MTKTAAGEGPVERLVGRPVGQRAGAGTPLQAAVGALLHRHALAQGLVPPIGCSECAWGKVAGCWRCGSR